MASSIPEFGLRADLEPERETARVRPWCRTKPARFDIPLDNFCEIDHESMSATITFS